MIEEQDNNKVQDESGNSTKPLLSSRLFKFRACLKNSKEIYEVMSFCKDFVKVYTDITEKGYTKLSIDNFEPLMQFTGLKDKKGVEICEGDILYFDDDCTTEKVYYENGCFGTMGRYNFISLMDTNMNISKIIGNVFQNPELL